MENNQSNEQMVKAKKPITKRWWFWVIIVLVAIIVIANVTGEDKPDKETPADGEPKETVATQKDDTFGLNETAVFDNIKVTANEIKQSSGDKFFKPDAGKVFVGIQFTIENISNEEQNISSLLLFDAYVDGVKCDYSVNANCVFSDGTLDGELSSGKKMIGYYSVEVPENWAELELEVKSDWLSNAKAAFVFNK